MTDSQRLRRIIGVAKVLADLLDDPKPGDKDWMIQVHRTREEYLSLVMWLPAEFKHFPTDDR